MFHTKPNNERTKLFLDNIFNLWNILRNLKLSHKATVFNVQTGIYIIVSRNDLFYHVVSKMMQYSHRRCNSSRMDVMKNGVGCEL